MSVNYFFSSPYTVFRIEMLKEKFKQIPKTHKALAVAAWFAVIECGWFPHKQREFLCKDPSLSFKYNGDTVTATVLILSTFLPFFVLWVTEAIFAKPTSLKLSRTRTSLKRAFYWFKKYYVGILMNLALVETLKVVVGGLRPHFFYSCRPDVMDVCMPGEIIFRYACKNTEPSYAFIRDTQKSFPSGHSSVSFHVAIFLVWYFQKRIPKLKCFLLIPFLQTLCFSWACFCSMSRITDHRHHWYDVLAGVCLGMLFGFFCCKTSCNNFKGCRTSPNLDATIQNGVISRNSYKDREETSLNAV